MIDDDARAELEREAQADARQLRLDALAADGHALADDLDALAAFAEPDDEITSWLGLDSRGETTPKRDPHDVHADNRAKWHPRGYVEIRDPQGRV